MGAGGAPGMSHPPLAGNARRVLGVQVVRPAFFGWGCKDGELVLTGWDGRSRHRPGAADGQGAPGLVSGWDRAGSRVARLAREPRQAGNGAAAASRARRAGFQARKTQVAPSE